MKTTFRRLALLGVATAFLSGCYPLLGQRVEVPPASVGMVLGASGYQGDIIPPSRFRLDRCIALCPQLVVIEASDVGMNEAMNILMPRDNLAIDVNIGFTLSLARQNEQLLQVFDRVTPERLPSGNYGTTIDNVYNVYGAAIVRNVVRSTLSEYSISELANNQAAVSEHLRRNIDQALARTPLEVRQFGLAEIRYPTVVIEAMEQAQRRRIDIERAEADAQVRIREAQALLEVRRAEREADLLAAQTIAEANDILAAGVTPELIRYLELEALKEMARNEKCRVLPG